MIQAVPSSSPRRMKNRKILARLLSQKTKLSQEEVQKEVNLLLPLDPYERKNTQENTQEHIIDEQNLGDAIDFKIQDEIKGNKDDVREIVKMIKTLEEVIADLETNELSIRNLQIKIDNAEPRLQDIELLEVLVDLMHALNIPDDIIKVSPEYISKAKQKALLHTGKESVKKIEQKIKKDELLGRNNFKDLIKLQKRIELAHKEGASLEDINDAHIIKRLKNNSLKKDSE